MKLLSSELDSINTISYSEFRETFKGNLNTIEINPWLLKNTIQAFVESNCVLFLSGRDIFIHSHRLPDIIDIYIWISPACSLLVKDEC